MKSHEERIPIQNRLFTCGDTHQEIDAEKVHIFGQRKDLTKKDILMVLGDWGLIMHYPNHKNYPKEQKRQRSWARKPFTTLAQLGNHENWDLIEKLPTIEKFGGKVYELVVYEKNSDIVIDSLYIMQRGEIYTINGKTIFSMGGAMSQDKAVRNIGIDYWAQETPTTLEENYGIDNLKKHNFKVNFVATHTCPTKTGNLLKPYIKGYGKKIAITYKYDYKARDCVATYFQALIDVYNLKFDEWHFGHWHADKKIGDKFFCHYNNKPMLIIDRD